MPDVHEGYGSPIGGIAATAVGDGGIISPGMIGYDINCGVRLLRSTLTLEEAQPRLDALGTAIFREVPSGVGRGGRLTLGTDDLDAVLARGAEEIVARGYGDPSDLDHLESRGRLAGADPADVSPRAKRRGADQLGTMGAGNHFVEVQAVSDVFDERAATALGLLAGRVVVMIHTGSRGLGHQVATDFIRTMLHAMPKHGMSMTCGANFAWANRQLITWEVRQAFSDVFGTAGGRLEIVYDVAHNIGKLEAHEIDGRSEELLVHRKGATRAFPPGHAELHPAYRDVGQPVLIPGSMGTSSFVLVGTSRAMAESFGSCCHGAGRRMSRTAARRQVSGRTLKEELEAMGIVVRSGSMAGLAEEAPLAYKDVDIVVDVVEAAGLASRVARVRPIAVIKG
jgi:tRNA-splicing ligase RtcB